MATDIPGIVPLAPRGWTDYELLDSGEEAKLERFGPYTLARPEKAALWQRRLPAWRWGEADAVFSQAEKGEGEWVVRGRLPERWLMRYRHLSFWVRLTPFRHTGVFPEQASHWDWLEERIAGAGRPVSVLNLFAYTGVATLAAAVAGASVVHVDASRPTLGWAKDNAAAAGLGDRPIRWILDDALKFVEREARRGRRYDGIIMDPPVFGRGPNGELWRFARSFPPLLEACANILSDRPLFLLVTGYAIEDSSLTLYNLVEEAMRGRSGRTTAGELVLPDTAGRSLSLAIYARWATGKEP
ncbi:MAG: class I SAM-dependent methyltransferase [Chloroflexota bacterium]